MNNKCQPVTSATRQVRQRWFSVGIFPLRLLFGLTGNRPQSAPACSFLRCVQSNWVRETSRQMLKLSGCTHEKDERKLRIYTLTYRVY